MKYQLKNRRVHHGSAVLRKTLQNALYLQAEAQWRKEKRDAVTNHGKSVCKDKVMTKPKRDFPIDHRMQPILQLRASSLLIEILEYLNAEELVRMRQAGGKQFTKRKECGYGPCELAASLSLRRIHQKENKQIYLHAHHVIHALHLELTSCTLTILRRREPILRELAAARGVALLAREAHRNAWATFQHLPQFVFNGQENTDRRQFSQSVSSLPQQRDAREEEHHQQNFPQVTTRLSEQHAINGVVVADGIFADARLFENTCANALSLELTPYETKALQLAARCLDGDIGGLGECVIASLNTSYCPRLKSTALKSDGCWVLRRVDGRPCWSPRTFNTHVHDAQLANKKLRLDFDQAYDRRDIKLPLAAPAAAAVHLAKSAFGLDTREDVVLLATGDEEHGRAVSPSGCWTSGDYQQLKHLGLATGIKRTLILVVLPNYSIPPVLPSYVSAELPRHHRYQSREQAPEQLFCGTQLHRADFVVTSSASVVDDNSDAISELSSSSSASSVDFEASAAATTTKCDSDIYLRRDYDRADDEGILIYR